jgi:two-component system LytT family response regulator
MTRRVLIVDDETLARERMRHLLGAFDQLVIVGECANGDAAIDAVAALRPDIVFLDVQMPGADGFDVLAALDDRVDVVEMPLIIFVTAFDEYATHAFEVAALDYLRKPVSRKRLGVAVSRAVTQLELLDSARAADRDPNRPVAELDPKAADTYATRFVVKRGDVAHFVRPGDIDWIDAAANYVRLQCRRHGVHAPRDAGGCRLAARSPAVRASPQVGDRQSGSPGQSRALHARRICRGRGRRDASPF